MISARALRITLYATLIFLGGGITGAFVAPRFGRSFMRPPDPKQMSRYMLERLQSGLDLTDEQAAKIKPIIEKAGVDMEAIRHETTKRVLNRIAEANAQISLLLTPEQKRKFIKMEAEHRRRLGHGHPFGEPPGPPPPPVP